MSDAPDPPWSDVPPLLALVWAAEAEFRAACDGAGYSYELEQAKVHFSAVVAWSCYHLRQVPPRERHRAIAMLFPPTLPNARVPSLTRPDAA